MELAPQGATTRSLLSIVLLALDRGEEALAEASREPHEAFRSWALAIIHHSLGNVAESDSALEEMIEKYSEDSAFQIAEVCAVRGEADRAFEWLERAYAQRDGGLTGTKVNLRLPSLHHDPRWGPFMKKMRLGD